jgi:two-component system, LytTR family, response regulator
MNIPIRTVIVDDEADAVNFIRSIIGEYCPDLEIVGVANSAGEGVQMILKHHPDLVFLDVEMPHGSGFDLLARFPEKMFDVIFITAFNQYALRAIKFSAVDYILKPINISEFIEAVKKVTEKRLQGFSRNTGYHELLENLKSTLPTRLAIPVSDGLEYLNAREIIRIEADRSYSRFYLVNKKTYLVSKNLKEYQDLLTHGNFFRPHHSHLINLEYVKKYVRQEGGFIEMVDGSTVPLSRVKRELFVQQMARLSR